MKRINYNFCQQKAYEQLIIQDFDSFPIDIFSLELTDAFLMIETFKKCSEETKSKISDYSINEFAKDAYCFRDNFYGIYVILYNDEIISDGRKLWTLAHEIGHLILKHPNPLQEDISDEENQSFEGEADFFASQLLLPDCILKDLIKNGVPVTSMYLSKTFGISMTAATNRLKSMRIKYESSFFETDLDEIIILKYENFLKKLYPKSKRFNIDEELEEQRKRDNWF